MYILFVASSGKVHVTTKNNEQYIRKFQSFDKGFLVWIRMFLTPRPIQDKLLHEA